MSVWILLGIVVGCTVLGDVLSSFEMKRHGEVQEFHPRGLVRLLAKLATRKFLILSVFFMAISFFAFIKLVETADLSFAVPASAATMVFETILARLICSTKISAESPTPMIIACVRSSATVAANVIKNVAIALLNP